MLKNKSKGSVYIDMVLPYWNLLFVFWNLLHISFTFAPAMIDRRERVRSLLHFQYRPEGLKKKGYEC